MNLTRALVLALAMMLAGCSRAPVVTIVNHSSVTLANVIVSGAGFSQSVGSIEPGAAHRLSVHPRGETGLRVQFDAGGRHMDSGEQDYFEDSDLYRVTATVNNDLSVSVTSDLR